MKLRLCLAALCACVAPPVAAQPPGIPPDLLPYIPRNVGSYFVGFLVSAEHPQPMSRELFIRHQNYMRTQFEAGVYHLAGPMTDNGRIHGMVILSAPDADAARAIVAADPAVQAGAMAVEVHPAMFPDLSGLRVEYSPRP
jgi:uncharacterized protein YciI